MPDIQTTATADTDDPIRNIEKQISELQSLPRATDISGPMMRHLLTALAVLADQVLVLQGRARVGDNEFAKLARSTNDKPNE